MHACTRRYRELRAKERQLHGVKNSRHEEIDKIHAPAEAALIEYKKAQNVVTEMERERAKFHGSKETYLAQIQNLKAQLGEKQYARARPPCRRLQSPARMPMHFIATSP